MEPKMSRHWITGIAIASCVSLVAFAPIAWQGAPAQGAPKGAPVMAPTAWVVTFELSKWDTTKPPEGQPGFAEHHAGVMKMAKEGTLLVGGPFLDGSEPSKPTGVMMIVKAENAEAAKKLVSEDPLVKNDMIKVAAVRGFLAGAGAWLPAAAPAPGAPKH
jgi:uncharacterized protein YciI